MSKLSGPRPRGQTPGCGGADLSLEPRDHRKREQTGWAICASGACREPEPESVAVGVASVSAIKAEGCCLGPSCPVWLVPPKCFPSLGLCVVVIPKMRGSCFRVLTWELAQPPALLVTGSIMELVTEVPRKGRMQPCLVVSVS